MIIVTINENNSPYDDGKRFLDFFPERFLKSDSEEQFVHQYTHVNDRHLQALKFNISRD